MRDSRKTSLPLPRKKLTQQNSPRQLIQLYPGEDEITFLKSESNFPFLDKPIDFITWARLPPAQATWQSAQQPNFKDSICNLCIPTVPGEGFPSDDRRLFICDLPSSLHSPGWLFRFLALCWGQRPWASIELGIASGLCLSPCILTSHIWDSFKEETISAGDRAWEKVSGV